MKSLPLLVACLIAGMCLAAIKLRSPKDGANVQVLHKLSVMIPAPLVVANRVPKPNIPPNLYLVFSNQDAQAWNATVLCSTNLSVWNSYTNVYSLGRTDTWLFLGNATNVPSVMFFRVGFSR